MAGDRLDEEYFIRPPFLLHSQRFACVREFAREFSWCCSMLFDVPMVEAARGVSFGFRRRFIEEFLKCPDVIMRNALGFLILSEGFTIPPSLESFIPARRNFGVRTLQTSIQKANSK